MIELLQMGAAYAAQLPPRPEQAPLDARSCPTAPVVNGEIDELMPDCDGIVLSLQEWEHLERLAVDSRTVRAHVDLLTVAHKEQVSRLDGNSSSLPSRSHGTSGRAFGALVWRLVLSLA